MKQLLIVCLSCAVAMHSAAAPSSAPAGEEPLPLPSLNWNLPPCATLENGILTIDVPAGQSGMNCATATLDLSQCPDGFVAEISARGENISKASAPWLGLKFMVHYKDPEMGIECYPDIESHPRGTFTNTTLRLVDAFPGRVRQNPKLHVGLQGCSGKAVFDLSTLRLFKAKPAFPRVNQDYRVAYPDGMESPGSLRGFMTPHQPTERDFADMAALGATLVRYQMTRETRGFDEARHLDFAAYRAWLEARLDMLEQVLEWGNRHGIEVVVDMHYTPGGTEKRGLRINYRQDCLDEFVESWRVIAARFKGRKGIYGYDLVNEPRHRDGVIADYWEVQRLAAEAIREIDPDATIIVESNGGSQPDSYAYLSPLAMDNVIYQVHLYNPGEYTFQGVFSLADPRSFKRWPNLQEGWDREWLANVLRPVREFQARHGARILVGEFSAAAWVPGAENYLRDCIDLFREYGWDWTYHAFRESPCWDLEKEGPDIEHMTPSADNPRMHVIRDGLKGIPDGVPGLGNCRVSEQRSAGTASGLDPSLVAVIADTHVCGLPPQKIPNWDVRRPLLQVERLRWTVAQILMLRPLPANVIGLGDYAFLWGLPEDYAILDELLAPLEKAGIRVTLAIGDHDRRDNFLAQFPRYAETTRVPGRLVSRVETPHCVLLLLDTVNDDPIGFGEGTRPGNLGAAQRKWLVEELAAEQKPVIVCGHHGPKEGEVNLTETLWAAPSCKAYLHGHWHRWMPSFERVPGRGLLPSFSFPSTGHWGDIGFALLRTCPERAEIELRQSDWWDEPNPGAHTAFRNALLKDRAGQIATIPFR